MWWRPGGCSPWRWCWRAARARRQPGRPGWIGRRSGTGSIATTKKASPACATGPAPGASRASRQRREKSWRQSWSRDPSPTATGWHGAAALEVPANLTLLPLPPKSPELNPVENVWEYLRQNQLSLRVWPDYPAIVETCCRAWTALMAMPDRLASITRRQWAKTVTS